jgi:hypothetical protein
MNDLLFEPSSDSKTDESRQTGDEGKFDPNKKSLSEGSEFVDDALRMVEQPLSEED